MLHALPYLGHPCPRLPPLPQAGEGTGVAISCRSVAPSATPFQREAARPPDSEITRSLLGKTEAEIRADKDRLRAEYALKIHQQQVALEETKLASARQVIELNRRDARINGLEADVEALTSSLEGAVNARSVLEQTVASRLPRIEERLIDAKRNLSERDTEIANLTRTAERQARALKEAEAINDQLKRETQTLTSALEAAGAKAPGRPAEDRTDGFVAMRAELNALRARTREQSALIDRLQKSYAETIGPDGQPAAKSNGSGKAAPRRVDTKAANGKDASDNKLREAMAEQEQEIARLKAAVAVYEKAARSEAGGAIPESRIALKASLGALEDCIKAPPKPPPGSPPEN